MTDESRLVFFGTYTRKGGDGIEVYRFDPADGSLTKVGSAKTENPSFLALHPNGKVLYAANEMTTLEGEKTGAVSAFTLDPDTGELTLLNYQQPSHGMAACHLTVDQAGTYVYVANYGSGTAAVFPINPDGSLAPASDTVQHVGSGPDERRQQGPHAHSANLSPDGRFLFVADLGIDKLMRYDLSDPASLTPAADPWTMVAGGRGPRHFTFSPDGTRAYLITEMGNTLIAFDYDAATGALTQTQEVPTLPEEWEGRSTCADVHTTADGKYLYGSNRGHDSLVIYAIADDGTLSYVGHQSTLGKTPRNFAIDPSGRYILVAHQDSDNVVVFALDSETGKLTPTGTEVTVSMPVCVLFQ